MLRNLKYKSLYIGLTTCLIIFLFSAPLFAGDATLSWDPPITNVDGTPLTDLAGFIVDYGTATGVYSNSINVGNVTTYQVINLTDGLTYYFAVTAYDTSGNESEYSDEVSKTIEFSCSYSISPTSESLGYNSDAGSVSVTAPGGCAWTASSNASWLTITSGSSGSGNGTVNYSAAANSGMSSRIGTMTIAGQTFTVYQSVLFGTPTVPVPIGQQSFPYDPTTTPEASPNPAEAMPIGVGDVAMGGDNLSIQINLGQCSVPVDIYGAYMLSTDPDNIYVLNPDLTFQVFSVEEIVQALSDGAFPVGIEPWIENTIGLIDETLFDMPTSGLPTGIYYLYLLVTPAAGSLDNYYLWETYFEVL